MSRKIFELFALTAGLFISAHASENVNTPENRQFLKQQETLSQQLREKPDTQLQAWAEQQVRANPLQHSDNQFLDELVRKQQAAQKDKPQQGAVYFVSFSIRLFVQIQFPHGSDWSEVLRLTDIVTEKVSSGRAAGGYHHRHTGYTWSVSVN